MITPLAYLIGVVITLLIVAIVQGRVSRIPYTTPLLRIADLLLWVALAVLIAGAIAGCVWLVTATAVWP